MEQLNGPYRRWRANLNDPLTADAFTSVEFYMLDPASKAGESDAFVRIVSATDLLVAPAPLQGPVEGLTAEKPAATPLDPSRRVSGPAKDVPCAFMPLVECSVVEEFDWTCTQPKIGTLSFSFNAPWLMDAKRHDTEGVDELFAFLDMFDYTDGSPLDAASRPVCLIGVRSGFYEFNALEHHDEDGRLVADESDYTLDSTVYFPYTIVSKTYDYGTCTFSVECEDVMGLLSGFRAYSYKSASYACACSVNRAGEDDFGVDAAAGGKGAYAFDAAAFRAGRTAAKRATLLHNMAQNMMAQPSVTHSSVFPASSHRGAYVDQRAMAGAGYGSSGAVFEPDFTALSAGLDVAAANARSLATRGTELFKPADVDASRAGLGFSTDYAWDTSFLDLWYSVMNLHGMRLFPVDLGESVGERPPYMALRADEAPSLTEDGAPMRIYPSVIYDGAPSMETLESPIVSSSAYRGFAWGSKVPGDSLAYDDEVDFEVDVAGKVPVVADRAHAEGSASGKTFVNTDSAIFPHGLFCAYSFGHMAWSTPKKVPVVGLAAVIEGEPADAGDWWATDVRAASQSAYSAQGWTWGLGGTTARSMPSFAGRVSGGKLVSGYPPVGERFGYAKPRGDGIVEVDQALYRDGAAADGSLTLLYPKNSAEDVVVTNPLASAAVRDGLRVSSGRDLRNRLCWNAECALESAKNASGHPYHRSSYKATFATKNDPSMRVGNVVEVAYHDRWAKVLLSKSSRSLGSSKKCEWEGWLVGYGEGSPLDYSMGAASIRTWVNGARSHLEIAVNDNIEALVNHDVRYELVRTAKAGIEERKVAEATLDDPTALLPGPPESAGGTAAYHLEIEFDDLPSWRDDDRIEARTWLDGVLVDALAHGKGGFAASAWLWPGDFDTRIYPSAETWPGSRLLPWDGIAGTYPELWLYPGSLLFPAYGDGTASYASVPLPAYPSAATYPHGNEF